MNLQSEQCFQVTECVSRVQLQSGRSISLKAQVKAVPWTLTVTVIAPPLLKGHVSRNFFTARTKLADQDWMQASVFVIWSRTTLVQGTSRGGIQTCIKYQTWLIFVVGDESCSLVTLSWLCVEMTEEDRERESAWTLLAGLRCTVVLRGFDPGPDKGSGWKKVILLHLEKSLWRQCKPTKVLQTVNSSARRALRSLHKAQVSNYLLFQTNQKHLIHNWFGYHWLFI